MTNIVVLVSNRPRLTHQCLQTLYETTDNSHFNLTIVDDGSYPETARLLIPFYRKENCQLVTFLKPVQIVGFLRNVGIAASERFFGRGDWLYLSDNDIAFLPDWLEILQDRLTFGEKHGIHLLGGVRHPFHNRIGGAFATALVEDESIILTDAVAGYSHMMRWSTWDKFGPFDAHAKGVCQSEDYAFCMKIQQINNGKGYVGYWNGKPILANCGITNSEGKPAIGSESFPRQYGLIYA